MLIFNWVLIVIFIVPSFSTNFSHLGILRLTRVEYFFGVLRVFFFFLGKRILDQIRLGFLKVPSTRHKAGFLYAVVSLGSKEQSWYDVYVILAPTEPYALVVNPPTNFYSCN